MKAFNKALHRKAIRRCFIAAAELRRYLRTSPIIFTDAHNLNLRISRCSPRKYYVSSGTKDAQHSREPQEANILPVTLSLKLCYNV